jgi:hypothetical protein
MFELYPLFLEFCNIVNRTSVGLDLGAEAEAELEQGQTYFVSVTAINSAGLSTTSSSNGVTIDTSPPVVQGFSITDTIAIGQNTSNKNISSDVTAILTNQCKISAVWDYIIDEESDIKHVLVCATTSEENCDLMIWREFSPHYLPFSLDFQTPLQSGTVLMLKLQVENGAGLKTFLISGKVLVDNSPPVGGFVKINGRKSLVFLQEGQPLVASWRNFEDVETGIKAYKWKICTATQICVTEFISVGVKNSVTLSDIEIGPGIEYVFLVKAVNFAGLESESVSNSFILDRTSPEIGIVYNGHDQFGETYHSSPTEISVSWEDFRDKESGISRYEICIGSNPGLCDLSEFRSVGLVTGAIVSNLNLTHNATYYATVCCTNGAGQTSFASSSGIIVDLTPPIGSNPRDGNNFDEDISAQDMFISANWDEFHDPESGILKYVVCAGTAIGACDLVSATTVNTFAAKLDFRPPVSSGTVVYITLWVYNNAGQSTEVYSDGVLVDNTPPNAGNVSYN